MCKRPITFCGPSLYSQSNILQSTFFFLLLLIFVFDGIEIYCLRTTQNTKRIHCQNKTKTVGVKSTMLIRCFFTLILASRFVWIPRNNHITHIAANQHRMSQSIKHITVISPFVIINFYLIHIDFVVVVVDYFPFARLFFTFQRLTDKLHCIARADMKQVKY